MTVERPASIVDLLQNPWVRIALEAIGVVLALWLIRELSGVLTPLLIGLALAYMLDPLVNLLTARKYGRRWAVTLVFGTGALVLLATLVIGVPKTWQEGSYLYRVALIGDDWQDLNKNKVWEPGEALIKDYNGNGRGDPSHYVAVNEYLVRKGWLQADPDQPDTNWARSIEAWFNKEIGKYANAFASDDRTILSRIGDIIGKLTWWVLTLLLIPIYGYFFSLNLPRVSAVIKSHIPIQHRERTLRIMHQIHQVVGAFFRGRVVICLVLGALSITGFSIARVQSFLLLGALMGFATAIPLATGLVMIPVLMLLYLGGADPWQYWVALSVFLTVQALEPLLISVIMGKGVEMHPVLVLVAILAFGSLLGAVGVLLAVPLAATARILIFEFVYPHLRQMAGLDTVPVQNEPPLIQD
jgi:predicted PurR-regulated permease PerM